MIKTGIIGNVSSLQPCVRQLSARPDVVITGKSSVGMPGTDAATSYSVPELSKPELFKEADALIIDRYSMVSFDLIKSAVRNYKHLLFTDIPLMRMEECIELQKLVAEAGTIFQIKNPFGEDHGFQWLLQHWSEPAIINLYDQASEAPSKQRWLISLILMARQLFGVTPNQASINGIRFTDQQFTSLLLRLDYPTQSIFNAEFITQKNAERSYRAVMGGEFYYASGKSLMLNGLPFEFAENYENAIDTFIAAIHDPHLRKGLTLTDLQSAIETLTKLESKASLNLPWYS